MDALRSVGTDPRGIRPADIERAAEIHEHEGFSPSDAFQLAIVRSAVEDGLMTPAQVKEQYGAEIALYWNPRPDGRRGTRSAPGAGTGGQAPAAAGERVRGGAETGTQGAQTANAAGSEVPLAAETGRGEREAAAAGRADTRPAADNNAARGERNAPANAGRPRGKAAAAPVREAPVASTAPLIGERVKDIPEHTVSAADGTKVRVAPVVVEAKDLITSFDPGYDHKLAAAAA